MATLGEKLLAADNIEWPPGLNTYFIPINIIREVMPRADLKKELQRIYPNESDLLLNEHTDFIHNKSLKVFAILLGMGKAEYVRDFIQEGITDRDLPFMRSFPSDSSQTNSFKSFRLCRNLKSIGGKCTMETHEKCLIKAMSGWSDKDIRTICRDQWVVQAPVFDRKFDGKIPHYELDDNVLLPFVEDGERNAKSSGYSEVWSVRIHFAHQNIYKHDCKGKGPLLAVKRLFTPEQIDFQKETDMLSALAGRHHPHIVELLATFRFKGKYHLIFPHAEANLRSYWGQVPSPSMNDQTYLWFLRQIYGIASGLNAIHNFENKKDVEDVIKLSEPAKSGRAPPVDHLTVASADKKFGRHGDIKPENILWFNSQNEGSKGKLQLADFGLGRFHGLGSRSAIPPHTITGSATYMPPEVMLKTPISRAYDMWSLGCVYLEFICWLLEGSAGINAFADGRGATGIDEIHDDTFYSLVAQEGVIKYAILRPGVTQKIEELFKSQRCSDMVRDVLKIVQSQLLVIEPKSRISSKKLDSNLSTILRKAEASNEYLLGVAGRQLSLSVDSSPPARPRTPYILVTPASKGP